MFDPILTGLGDVFAGKPLHILLVAALFLLGYVILRYTGLGKGRQPNALLVPSGAWLLYAVWEWAVLSFSPEASIRIDLLAIWLVLLVLSIWSIAKAIRKKIPQV